MLPVNGDHDEPRLTTTHHSSSQFITTHHDSSRLITTHHDASQAEYEAEGVPWTHIEYEDNAAVIELLAKKRLGAFALLEEECRLQASPRS